jgi:feruloyl esterase
MGAKSMAKASGWNELAQRIGFAVLYPEQTVLNNGSSCFNWFREKDQELQGGETASILAMVQHIRQHYPIDSQRIYIYGVSAGAAMAVNVLANAPCQFQSGAILAGGPYKAATSATQALKAMRNPHHRSPSQWAAMLPAMACKPSLIVLHGTQDKVVDPLSSAELINQWTGLHQTPPTPDTVIQGYASNPDIQLSTYRNPQGNWILRHYQIAQTGHAIPIDPGPGPHQGGNTGIFAVDRDFFSTYHIAQDWGLLAP